jgi:glyoxylase-like metal-dependent hydrolase (beta-lactamase superfamily II)
MLRTTDFDGVTRFDLARTLAGRGRYWTSAYRVGDLLIDTGCAHTARELADHMSGTRVDTILNTHTHEDHIGANGLLQRRHPGLDILAHPRGVPVLNDPRGRQPLRPYQRVMWGWPLPSVGRPVDDGEVLEIGGHHFLPIHTPGHSDDHLCFFEPDRRWLFTGDLFVGGRERALRLDFDIWAIIGSLKKISALQIDVMFPGSARVRQKPEAEIRAKIDYLEEFGGKVLDLRRRGAGPRQIVRQLCGGRMLLETITLGHYSRRSLVESYLRKALP